ncbi:MAG: hypothetical protein H6965_14405 [Chromatiaceae bacterium]|nr:hypothetical protein [Chromatiaceae bacterium]
MNYVKLLNELQTELDASAQCRQRHQDARKAFLMRFKAEEQKLRQKLKNTNDEESRCKWERKLGLVQEAYVILNA